MFALHVLGTSGSRPTATRSVSGNYLMTPHGGLVIDCGEGFQERLVRQDLRLKRSKAGKRAKASKVRAILLTHCHLDHCWGLIPFLHTMNLDGRTEPLTIIAPGAPKGLTRSLTSTTCSASGRR
ncbi:MAG: MBL fold metallo-hydrolase [Candidatus Thalassarchaeum sp.]